jgi:tRNA(Ile)-lysidine synthase
VPRFSPTALLSTLDEILPADARDLCIAFSGGLDSTALLVALARIAGERPDFSVRAVHIDHQLHPESSHWSDHCAEVGRTLSIEVKGVVVTVPPRADSGPEAAARKARYDAFRKVLEPGEVLLTAHHADDQLETILLALMRGAGLRGLAAMSPLQRFQPGWLARPLLQFTRSDLEEWIAAEGVQWISDPSNENTTLDRNYLRTHVVPALRERWPAAARSANRTAKHVREAGELLDVLAAADLGVVAVDKCLSVARLRALDPARRRNVLRFWFRRCGMRAPSTRKLAAMEHDLFAAGVDRVPCVAWDDAQVWRHRGLLHCVPCQPPLAADASMRWRISEPVELPASLGSLRLRGGEPGGISAAKLADVLDVRFRHGGETLRPAGDPHHRKLKKLLQEASVLPWWRDRLPLIYSAGSLVAVGDLWIAEEFSAGVGEATLSVVWENKPAIR